ncbi:MAG: hypothetical protein ACOYOV_16915 [Bacteroidales bacterium]
MKKIILFLIIIATLISCSKLPDLGNRYKLGFGSFNDLILMNYKNTIIIDGLIVNYSFDSIFFIAKQKPRDFILKDTYDDPSMNIIKRDKIFEASTFFQYWIINKTTDSIFGPMTKEKYLKKFEELKIPKELILKEE